MDEPLLAKKNINVLSIVPDTIPNRYIVVFEYQWRNHGRPVWSKDFIRVATAAHDEIRTEITERVLELRKALENGVED